MAKKKEKWLIFVDTNILLDFYRLGGESASRQLNALERHKGLIITGDQVRMEFLKNRQKVLVDSINQLKKSPKPSIPPILTDCDPVRMLAKHHDRAEQQLVIVRKKIERILKDPSSLDQVYQSLNRIFDNESEFNLMRPNKIRFTVRRLARKRFVLGYPPRKQSDNSIGDALNWEWIIHCAQTSHDNHNVLIVSRDSDFGVTHGDVSILNDWLRREFKERVSFKRKIELTNRLTNALKRLDEAVKPEDVAEETKLLDSPRLDVSEIQTGTSENAVLSSKDLDEFIERLLSKTTNQAGQS